MEVGVTVNFLENVMGIVTAYEVDLTETDFRPYFVVQSFAVENS